MIREQDLSTSPYYYDSYAWNGIYLSERGKLRKNLRSGQEI